MDFACHRVAGGGLCTPFYYQSQGFASSPADACLYVFQGGDVLLLLYVDDILLSGRNTSKIEETKRQLMDRFEVVDLGPATFLLGLAIKRDDSTGTIQLSQETYARGILDTYGMEEANPAKPPAEVKQISIKEKDVLTPDRTTYFRAATGSLLYLSRCTRPDLAFPVMILSRSMSSPGKLSLIHI